MLAPPPAVEQKKKKAPSRIETIVARKVRKRVPKSAAILVTVTGEDATYEGVMRRARERVALERLQTLHPPCADQGSVIGNSRNK